jgi:tetratricopeptide (TPR) repeat protein
LYREAQALQHDGELERAKARYLEVLKLEPDHADALHGLGNIDARQGRLDDAERSIRKAIEREPLRASFVNSLGNILKSRGQLGDAAALYRQAVQLRPDFAVAHNNLGDVLIRDRRYEDAVEACMKALASDPNLAGAYNNLGRALNNMGRLEDAADALRRAVLIRADYAVAYDNLGHVLRAQGKPSEAREAFEHAIAIDTDLATARFNLATVLTGEGDLDAAIEQFEVAARLRPQHVPTLLNLGIAYQTRRNFKKSAASYRRAIRLQPEDATLHLHLGLVLIEQRRGDEAEACFRRALELDPEGPQAYAELAAHYEESNQLDKLREIVDAGLERHPDHPRLNLEAAKLERRDGRIEAGLERLARFDPARMNERLAEQFHYQLGYLHDRADDAEAAYAHFERANAIAAQTPRARAADPARYRDLLDAVYRFFDTAEPGGWLVADPPGRPSPIFLLGFPRSGTTLLDVVLDSHPELGTLEEKNTIVPAIEALSGRGAGYPASLAELDQAGVDELRALYYGVVDRQEHGPVTGRFVDKMPLQTGHVGALWRIFPDARFIFCRRHPCDVVLSNFMQHYVVSDAYANFYTLEDTVRLYDKVMRLWRLYVERLPITYHVVGYEALIEDLEGEVRSLLAFLDLDWDPAMLDFVDRAQRRGSINTSSYHQVTQPLYGHARDRWRRYGRFLEPRMDMLAPHIEYFGYER